MPHTLDDDLDDVDTLLAETQRYAARVLADLPDRPAVAVADDPEPAGLPDTGAGARAALTTFAERWAPGFSGGAGPRYFGFVTGGVTPAALAGDWLTGVFDQNAVAAVGSSAAALERETVAWIGDLLGLDGFTGSFVTGATMSNFVGLAIGRDWFGEQHGVSVAEEGMPRPARVLSGAAHASISKALAMLGMGRSALVSLPTLPGREAVDVAALERELAQGPAIVVANAGTVNTVDFDDLRVIADLKERYDFWLHVDAAFGGFAAASTSFSALLDGWAEADSVCVDLHKWLNVPYDAAVQFTRHRDLQLKVFANASAYLGGVGEVPDFMHLTPENSRRLRALAAWFTLAAYGREGCREIVERNVACARELEARLDASPRWRLLAPVRLNVVCFTLADDPTPERVDEVVAALAASGEGFVSKTVYDGVPALRAAFSNWRTTPADVDRVASALGA
ncbi:MAG: pyridoxal phosphate-dependent decarboxylase family protein [Microbacterium sp.]|uniref:pyridoxal phosphate-dependent decarboxylase family protein n=1 Tax=Microbacterium sp. TaxID=51671 RepID=UPI003A86335B